MPLHEENQIIAFKKIRTLTPIKQVEEVERLATKEPSKLNFVLNVYLVHLYKCTSDGTYSAEEKKMMQSTTDKLKLNLSANHFMQEDFDPAFLKMVKNSVANLTVEPVATR